MHRIATKIFTANYFTFNYQRSILMIEITGELRETVSLFKMERLRNLCIKSILFQAYKGEIWLRLWGATVLGPICSA